MLEILLWGMILFSGSVFCAANFQKRFEYSLPITLMTIILLLFAFGILGQLKTGVYVILILAVICYMISAAKIMKGNQKKAVWKALVTPGMVVFLLVLVTFPLFNYGRLARYTDEFSHWIDVVKVMTNLDDFATNPQSHSLFQSYPPALSLFQYFLQKLVLLCDSSIGFSEWHTFLAYEVLFFAMLFPLFRNLTFKTPIRILTGIAVIFVSPTLFYGIYTFSLVDPLLSSFFAAAISGILLFKEKDVFYHIYIGEICAVLTLTKDVGTMFAIFVAAAYGLDLLLGKNLVACRTRLVMIAGIAATIIIPKLSWNHMVWKTGAVVNFSNKVDLGQLIAVFTGGGEAYRRTVLVNYAKAFIERPCRILNNLGITVPYITLVITTMFLLYLIYKAYALCEPERKKTWMGELLLLAALLVVYIIGLCVMYMFKFSEYEAVNLASYERYLDIAFLAIYLVILISAAEILWSLEGNRQILEVSFLYLICAISPLQFIGAFVTRQIVSMSYDVRDKYVEITQKIEAVADGDDRICVISQEDGGYDQLVLKFCVRPNIIDSATAYSLGPGFYEGDIWTEDISPKEWMEELTATCDYVALFRLNDYFYDTYDICFEDPSEIAEETVFRVNKETGRLQKCK